MGNTDHSYLIIFSIKLTKEHSHSKVRKQCAIQMKIDPTILYFHCWLFYLAFSIVNRRSGQTPYKSQLEHGHHQHPPSCCWWKWYSSFNNMLPLTLIVALIILNFLSLDTRVLSTKHQLDLPLNKIASSIGMVQFWAVVQNWWFCDKCSSVNWFFW